MRRKIILSLITSETIFYGWCKWKVHEFETNVKPYNESDQPFPFEQRRKLVDKLFKREFISKERGKKWLEGWFYHEKKLEDMSQIEIRTFLSWAYFNKKLEELNEEEMKEIEEDVNLKLGTFEFKKENSTQRMLRPNMDKLQDRILHKPLVFYFLSEIVVQRMIVPLAMRLGGFRKSAVRDEEGRTLKYWYRESSSTNNTPIVFFHGVGIGVLPYVSLFRDIVNATVEDRLIIAPEFPSVSLTVPIDIGTNPKETSNLLNKILREHKIQRVIFVAHSFGVWPLSWLLKHFSQSSDLSVEKSIIIDPVNVGVHRANLCRAFLYDPPQVTFQSSRSFYKFMLTQTLNRDARVVSTFMRNIRWYESFILEELENIECEKMTFFFSERDSYMDAEQDYNDVKRFNSSDVCLDAKLWKGVIHGEFLIRDDLCRDVLNEILCVEK